MRKFGLILTLIITIALCCGCTKDISGLSENQQIAIMAIRSFEEEVGDYNESDVLLFTGKGFSSNEEITFVYLNRETSLKFKMESDGDVLPAQPSTPYIFYKKQFYTLDYCESLVRELQGNGYDDYKTNIEKASQIELELYDCGMHAVGYELGQEKDNFTIVPYVDIQEFI